MNPRSSVSARAVATLAATVLVVTACTSGSTAKHTSVGSAGEGASASDSRTSPAASAPTSGRTTSVSRSTSAPTTSRAPAGPTKAQLLAAAAAKAKTAIGPTAKLLGKGGISIEAVNTDTGATFTYGAKGGMRTGSIIKLYILETLLLQRQDAGASLSSYEKSEATTMIENSDNDAAAVLYRDAGGPAGLAKMKKRLGLHNTQPNRQFGLTTTCASDYIALVRNANSSDSPLHRSARNYIRNLQANIEADQRWGVSAAADKGTMYYLKNGWLAVDSGDHGLWLINSVGDVTVNGHVCYLVVLTQHGPPADYVQNSVAYTNGQHRVEKLAKIAAAVVAPK